MSKLISLLSVVLLCGWMVGCAPEDTSAPPADDAAATDESHDDHDHAEDAPPADDAAPESGSVE